MPARVESEVVLLPGACSRRRTLFALVTLVLVLLTGCEETPAGRSQLALIPDAYLEDMGRQAFAELKRSQSPGRDYRHQLRVNCVADHVLDAAKRRYADRLPAEWDIAVFQIDQPNAFAMPGGGIGVNTGLLRIAETDAQLAAVLGHEVGHLLARHGNERMTQQLGVNAILLLIGFFAEIDNELIWRALGLGAHLGVTLPFSRVHETEADLIGLELMAMAGFDPTESVALWRNMASASGAEPLEFLSTHPGHETRIADLESAMDRARTLYETGQQAECER